jgi:hypothetical protein
MSRYAVQEMLKVTSVLYEAVKNQSSLHDDDIEHDTSAAMAQLSAKIATTVRIRVYVRAYV